MVPPSAGSSSIVTVEDPGGMGSVSLPTPVKTISRGGTILMKCPDAATHLHRE